LLPATSLCSFLLCDSFVFFLISHRAGLFSVAVVHAI
jgi:hypothetical protein